MCNIKPKSAPSALFWRRLCDPDYRALLTSKWQKEKSCYFRNYVYVDAMSVRSKCETDRTLSLTLSKMNFYRDSIFRIHKRMVLSVWIFINLNFCHLFQLRKKNTFSDPGRQKNWFFLLNVVKANVEKRIYLPCLFLHFSFMTRKILVTWRN